MIIAEGKDVRIGVFDIETIVGMFDVGVYDPDIGEWFEFEISEYRNDLYKFVKFYLEGRRFDYWVSFNGIGFDHQVLQYIVDRHQDWANLSSLEIAGKIAEFGSKIIEDQDYELPPKYWEYQFPVKCIDLFRIHHMDNKAKRTSLKWCEYMMDMDVEEMPIHHTKKDISPEERLAIIYYRRHDVLATLELLKVTLGQSDLPQLKDYKGKNKIQDRFDVMKETGMQCLNWSDVKIGEEWNKLDYIREEKIKDIGILFKRKVKYGYGQPFKNFFPKSMCFQTPLFRDFVEKLGNEYVKNTEQEFPLTVGQTIYTFAKGGLHSTEKNRTIKVPKGYCYTDIDVGSQYPNFIIKEMIHAPHLANTIIKQLDEKVKRRFVYKDKAKELILEGKKVEARPFSSVQEMLKLCLNGGYFGKLDQEGSFIQYPEGMLRVCIGNQIEILMLIEMMDSAGYQVLSGNTDGITVMYPERDKDKFLLVCREWERTVGNVDGGKLEHTEFIGVWQDAVNSYIAKKADGTAKKKGKFLTEYELNKNKSHRIIALALEAYFINGQNPIDFITNHQNIQDFTAAKKASKEMYYEELIGKEIVRHKKLVKYYVSNDGNVIKKRGLDYKGNPVDSFCEAPSQEFIWMGKPLLKYCNVLPVYNNIKEYNINYSFYILKTLQRIDKISKTKMAKKYADQFKTTQITLF